MEKKKTMTKYINKEGKYDTQNKKKKKKNPDTIIFMSE
jgi:hypothetical protein